MGVKVATTVLHWSQPTVRHSPSSHASSSSSRRAVVCRQAQSLRRSSLFGTTTPRLHKSWSCEFPKSKLRTIRRSCSASLESFSDEEFSKKIQELALRFQLADDGDGDGDSDPSGRSSEAEVASEENPSMLSEPADWRSAEEIIPASIERRANSVELPVSMRMIKRKMRWRESLTEAGESAYCSVKKAFSSMVFIIRELHSYSLQMRELLFLEDMRGVLETVQKEMHASFVWLFQQVFSHTPTLMVYVMILLANFTVHSMAHSPAIVASAAASPPPTAIVETLSRPGDGESRAKFDSSVAKTFSVSANSGGKKTTSVGGGDGGGGRARSVASGTDGDGGIERSAVEEELALWNSIVDEAAEMEASVRDEALDQETVRNFVSPVSVKIESDEDYEEYFRTEMVYQMELIHQPNNALLLLNYAQFLYLVSHDYERAEEYFKRATRVTPADPAAHSKYGTFLWRVRNDIAAAEEAYLEAISVDPGNSSYAADYAHFLWNTGGDDTCYPLSDLPDDDHPDTSSTSLES